MFGKLKYAAPFAALMALSVGASAETVGLATLPPGAINNLQAQVIAKVVQEHSDLKVRVLPYRGGTAAMAAVDAGAAEFAVSGAANVTSSILGSHQFKDRHMKNLRMVFRVRAIPVGIYTRKDSDIKTFADLKGKRYPTRWTAFPTSAIQSNAMLATAGLSLDDVDGVPVTNIIRAADDFKAGKTDASTFAVGAPKMQEVNSAVGGIRWLNIPDTPASLKAIQSVHPDYYIVQVKPSPVNAGITKPTNVLGLDINIIANNSVPNETVYKFLEGVIPYKAELVKGHPSFADYDPKEAAKQYTYAKYHPGAIKYFQDKGMWPGS